MSHQTGSSLATSTTAGRTLVATVQQLGFWGSVLLPATYIPVLSLTSASYQLPLLLGLIALNVCCLVAGRNHLV